MTATVLGHVDNGVRTITLNRPHRLNAINGDLLAGLLDQLIEADADRATRAIVLRGAGRAFCSGDDLTEFSEHSASEEVARRFLDSLQEVTRRILFGDKIVIGAVHGWAVGGGFEWTINCDIVVMADGTRCFFPETELGMIVTGGATALLPRIVGLQRARALIVSGARIDAEQALAMGLAWRVVPESSLFDEAQALGERIASLPDRGVRDAKRLLIRPDREAIEAALEAEIDSVLPAFLDPATKARASAFKS